VSGNAQQLFTVDSTSGLVLTSGDLDREIRAQHRITCMSV